MKPLTILHPVYALDNELLAPPGTELSDDIMRKISALNRDSSYDAAQLLRYGTVREDLLIFLMKEPYRAIFSNRSEVSELMEVMETVQLPRPCLRALDYFRDRDAYTYRHVLLVFALSTLLAKDLLPDSCTLMELAATGPIHDIGKINISTGILKKTTPLTRTERSMVEHHPLSGYVLLAYYLRDPCHIAAIVARDHHERRDGSGYPSGGSISDKIVEIVAAADVYDALVSPRPYRPVSYDNRTALEEITAMAERGEIGWDIVKALIARNRSGRPHFTECVVSEEKRGIPPSDNVYGLISEEEGPFTPSGALDSSRPCACNKAGVSDEPST